MSSTPQPLISVPGQMAKPAHSTPPRLTSSNFSMETGADATPHASPTPNHPFVVPNTLPQLAALLKWAPCSCVPHAQGHGGHTITAGVAVYGRCGTGTR